MVLAEDHVLVGAVQRPPGPYPPFQRAPDTRADLAMATEDLLENGDRPQTRCGLQHRHDLAVPNLCKWVWPATAPRRLFLRRQSWVRLDAISGGGAEPGPRGSDGRGVAVAKTHIQPHLAIVDMEAGPSLIPLLFEESYACTGPLTTARSLRENAKPLVGPPPVGLRPPSVSPPAAFSHLDCR